MNMLKKTVILFVVYNFRVFTMNFMLLKTL